MAFAPCALADGVIVKSGSPSYPVGRVIQTGETVSLRDGESVSLMARSGEMFDLAGTRVFEEPAASRSASLADTARALAQGPRATGRIGGVRNDKMQACLNDAERRNLPTVDHCFEKAGPAPRLSIIAPKVAPETPAGARQYLKLSANFSGYGLCVMRAPGRDPVFLPGAEPARPLLLQKGLSLSWPSRGETGLVSDSAAPDALLTCHAVPEILWLASPGAIEAATPANVSALLTGLSRLHAVETASASARLQRIR